MYLPILRGKQFELIALRELGDVLQDQEKGKFSPIIEPVKKSFTTLQKTLVQLKNTNINFTLIVNPIVGELVNCTEDILEVVIEGLGDYSNFQLGIYSQSEHELQKTYNVIKDITFDFDGFSFLHIDTIKDHSIFNDYSKIKDNKYHLVNFNRTNRRYYRQFPSGTRVSLDDCFKPQPKNSAYLNIPDESFTEEHLYFSDDGMVGFSDYLTVGDIYSEAGFLPYAVAIHITYVDPEGGIRIRHFVSDSNDDTSDVGGKFAEALNKLIFWVEAENIHPTQGIEEFKDLHNRGHFPGLGVIKKLSIKHHIELMAGLI